MRYNKDILSIDYKNILIRFNTEYTNFLKIFKGSYGSDKKIVKGFCKVPSNKLADSEIINILNKIAQIKEKEQWLLDSKSIAVEMLGSLYMDSYTNWQMVEKCRANFKTIKGYFGVNKIPEKLKNILLEKETEKLITQHSILLKIIENNVLDFVESIFGSEASKQQISELLKEMQDTANVSIGIKMDYENILKHLTSSYEMDKVTVNDITEVLTSIKLVNQKRKWFSDNSAKLSDDLGKHYNGENTDWDNVKDQINIVEQVIEHFGKKQIPNKLINYLIFSQNSQDSFAVFKNDIDYINKKNIVIRLGDLLNIEDVEAADFNNVICTLEAIENGVTISYSKYVNLISP